METKKCPICGKPFSRTQRYRNGQRSGYNTWTATCSRTCGRVLMYGDRVERFWSHVNQSGGLDGCWPWMLVTDQNGYGRVRWDRKTLNAHRVAWALDHDLGRMPKLDVMHLCDNPPCCNPAHLREATESENMQDCFDKGRGLIPRFQGETHPQAVLSEHDVQVIRQRLRQGETQTAIAREYQVRQTTISRIKLRRTWSHLPDES